MPAFGGVAHRVRDEVGCGLANHVGIPHDEHAFLGAVLEREPRVGNERLVRGDDALDELAHIDHFLFHGGGAVFQAGELQERVNQAT